MKESKDDINSWKNILCSWVRRIDTVTVNRLLKAICTFKAIPIKRRAFFFHRIKTIILKFVCRHKRPQIVNTILINKNRAGGIILPEFRLYYKATIVKTV